MKKDEIQTFSYRISQANKTQLIVIMYDMAIQYVSDAIENNYETQQVYAGFTYSNDGGSNEYSKGYENRGYKV